MSTTAKIQHKGQVTIPAQVRNQVGLSEGDLVEFSVQRGKIVITPKLAVDQTQFPAADGEYTPEQRRIIDAQLNEAEEGPFHGPFHTAGDAIDFLKLIPHPKK